jgi:hypothetical protein
MQSLEEVREEALRYMNVIARPMVLQGDQHPIVWSHAYADFQVTFITFRSTDCEISSPLFLVFIFHSFRFSPQLYSMSSLWFGSLLEILSLTISPNIKKGHSNNGGLHLPKH